MEDALRNSEARFRQVVDSANEGVLVYDRDLNIATANAAAARIIGVPLDAADRPAGFHLPLPLPARGRRAAQPRGPTDASSRRGAASHSPAWWSASRARTATSPGSRSIPDSCAGRGTASITASSRRSAISAPATRGAAAARKRRTLPRAHAALLRLVLGAGRGVSLHAPGGPQRGGRRRAAARSPGRRAALGHRPRDRGRMGRAPRAARRAQALPRGADVAHDLATASAALRARERRAGVRRRRTLHGLPRRRPRRDRREARRAATAARAPRWRARCRRRTTRQPACASVLRSCARPKAGAAGATSRSTRAAERAALPRRAGRVADPDIEGFVEGSRGMRFKRGQGLIGLVWQSGEPVWSTDTRSDPRVHASLRSAGPGTRGAFALRRGRRRRDHRACSPSPARPCASPTSACCSRARDRRAGRPVPAPHAGRGAAAPERGALSQPDRDVVGLLLGDRPRSTASSTSCTGRSYSERMGRIVGHTPWEFRSVHPDAAGLGGAARQDGGAPAVPRFRVRTPLARRHRALLLVHGDPHFAPDGGFLGYRGVGRDVTDLALARERIASLAFHDALTGLDNRTSLAPALEKAVERTRRRATKLAGLFLDFDGFKEVNDRHGHDAGDRLLIEAARRLRATLRSSDPVARLGGDEFFVVLEEISDSAPAETRGAEAPGGARQTLRRRRRPQRADLGQHRRKPLPRRRRRRRDPHEARGRGDVRGQAGRQELPTASSARGPRPTTTRDRKPARSSRRRRAKALFPPQVAVGFLDVAPQLVALLRRHLAGPLRTALPRSR